jgi:hypothetical protein
MSPVVQSEERVSAIRHDESRPDPYASPIPFPKCCCRFCVWQKSSNHRQGTGRNAPAVCNSRHASRHSAFHRLRGRIRAWSPSHYVAEDKRVRTDNEAHGSIRLVRFVDICASPDQAIDAVGDSLIFYFLRRRIPHPHGKEADPLRELPPRSAELWITIGRAGTLDPWIAKSLLLIRGRSGRSRPRPARRLLCFALHD